MARGVKGTGPHKTAPKAPPLKQYVVAINESEPTADPEYFVMARSVTEAVLKAVTQFARQFPSTDLVELSAQEADSKLHRYYIP